jgi:hypothetical protein
MDVEVISLLLLRLTLLFGTLSLSPLLAGGLDSVLDVPEPSPATLLLIGAALLGISRIKFFSKKS